ncbi:MAG TPA: hypothetical protein VKA36_06380 [Solirubrobacterales bacterium]|nr:hypothetical protein [Solirubrobacterales bacterium]
MKVAIAQDAETVTVAGRYLGPPGYGNGGYSCGTFAAGIEGPAEVTLRRPVPLDAEIGLRPTDEGAFDAFGEEGLIAEARPAAALTEVEPPLAPGLEEAEAAAAGSPFLGPEHPYPSCFVCGPEHPDGMHLHAGPLERDPAVSAAPLRPQPSWPSGGGALTREMVWAALDCPSFAPSLFGSGKLYLLGRLAVERLAPVPAEEPSVVVGWELDKDGRKTTTAAALLTPAGELLARSRALWIELRK